MGRSLVTGFCLEDGLRRRMALIVRFCGCEENPGELDARSGQKDPKIWRLTGGSFQERDLLISRFVCS